MTGSLQSVKVIGRQELTNSEKARDELILLLLQGQKTLRNSPFIRSVWFPRWKQLKNRDGSADVSQAEARALTQQMGLNPSQQEVGLAMVSGPPIVIAHGPPGTGKTTTIAAATRIWDIHDCPVWIIAHSNVAVKNIAETLFKRNVDFKILVSKEFYVEWHEHLYVQIQEKLMRSDELPDNVMGMGRALGDSCIVLSTLSMLSNPALEANGTFDLVPVERLVIDEASQIKIFEFISVFEKFQDLEKVCFFGDPKQLPPFGQDRVPSLKTIFDLPQFQRKETTFFLDTQYRMPQPIGKFISDKVYRSRLSSSHKITDPSCVAFVDVCPPHGEETKSGFSWKNMGEIRTITHLVKNYYRHKNFCIITPYDAQRAAIEKNLKDENLPWDRVFNVDSFQGNEADYVLVSVVRSDKPGFLSSINRMNVLLTRCRAGLVVVTSKVFIKSRGGVHTLLGDLARHWQQHHEGQTDVWVDWKLVADGTANLPGSPGPKPRAQRYAAPPVNGYSNPSSRVHVPHSYKGPTGGFDVSSLFRRCPPPSNNRSVPIETPIKSTYAAAAEASQTDWSRLSLRSTAPGFPSVAPKRPQYYYPEAQPTRNPVDEALQTDSSYPSLWSTSPGFSSVSQQRPQYPKVKPTPDRFSSIDFPPLIVPNYKQGAPRYWGQNQNRFSPLKPKAPPLKTKSTPVSAIQPTQSFTNPQTRTEDFIARPNFQPNPAPQAGVLEDGWTRVDRRRGFGRRPVTYAEAAQRLYSSY